MASLQMTNWLGSITLCLLYLCSLGISQISIDKNWQNISIGCAQSVNAAMDSGTYLDLRFEIEDSMGPQNVELRIHNISINDTFDPSFSEDGEYYYSSPVNGRITNESNTRLFNLGTLSPSKYVFRGELNSIDFNSIQRTFEMDCSNGTVSECTTDICR